MQRKLFFLPQKGHFMTFLDIVKTRYSVRDFADTPVEDEKLHKILEAGKWAPSACNIQPCFIIVIRDDAAKRNLRPAYNRDWFINAPVILSVCVDRLSAWVRADKVSYGFVDAAIVMDHMVLAATELGLGTCWIGAFKTQEAKKALKLPENVEPVAFIPLGYPKSAAPMKKRKELEELVCWEYFGGKK
jgi:Nitroreductase